MSERQAREREIEEAANKYAQDHDGVFMEPNSWAQTADIFSAGMRHADSHAIPCTKCADLEKRVEKLRYALIGVELKTVTDQAHEVELRARAAFVYYLVCSALSADDLVSGGEK